MTRLRIEKRPARPAPRELEPLPLDPRDQDVVRVKSAVAPRRGSRGTRDGLLPPLSA